MSVLFEPKKEGGFAAEEVATGVAEAAAVKGAARKEAKGWVTSSVKEPARTGTTGKSS